MSRIGDPAGPLLRLAALGNGVWLDEIRREGKLAIQDVPGGSVTFATLGARLFVPEDPSSVALVLNAGYDFPRSVIKIFESWKVALTVHHLDTVPSARGLVFYEKANDNRKGFQRLTDPLPIAINDLRHPNLLEARALHFFGTAEYMEEQISDLAILRQPRTSEPAFVVWEPHAKSCRPDTLEAHKRAVRLVNVFSPNHEELASFFEGPIEKFEAATVERQAAIFLDAGIGVDGKGCMLVRAAGHGCFIISRGHTSRWLPSYYPPDSEKVVDATGAGNAFLGAFAIGWHERQDYVEAAKYGQVAASFVIEQVGLPQLAGAGRVETWNGCEVMERFEAYRKRLTDIDTHTS